jgi:type II restriction/modification system DNA methylase subunit YeeA
MPSKKPQKALPVAPDLIKIAPSMLHIPLSLRKYRASAPHMTPNMFIAKWRNVELKERTASQTHFLDICRLLEIEDPVSADPKGEWFTFEKGASKTSGGEGWADVWRKECFAWEYKGKHANLEKAYQQLLQYSVALENPPLLIVSDMDRIIIRTNWTNSVQEKHEILLDDLLDGDIRARLKFAFTDPEELKPRKTRQELTEETAGEFAGLAQRLRDRGHDAHHVAHFVNQLVFCMFAEDVDLLPNHMFTKMLQVCRFQWDNFTLHAGTLFRAMADKGGMVGFDRVEWFNGGLFDGTEPLPLTEDDVEQLANAAKRDWSQIDPSILGTLFERGLDPAKRSQLGAHYTDREKIMMIVKPVIIDPLEAEWAEALAKMTALIESAPKRTKEKLLSPAEKRKGEKLSDEAAKIHGAFIDRLVKFRVLDPACGSGNFLYVALRSIKDIEHRSNLDVEALGFPRGFPRVGPESVLGIELNPYAAELARVSVWIGEIQWMRRNGFDAAKNPILRNLDTIECRDAVLNADGTRAQWPVADVVVGNPPFLGNKKMIRELGEDYTVALRKAWPEVPGGVDLVCYWFAKAWAMMAAGKIARAGLVATNSIRGGANRDVLKPIVEHGRIFEAWSDEEWTVDGAAVRVSMVCFDRAHGGEAILEGAYVAGVFADLTASIGVDVTKTRALEENRGICFVGVTLNGEFELPAANARNMLLSPRNVNGELNSDVLRPSLNGDDFNGQRPDKWVVDFGTEIGLEDAALYELPYSYINERVRPYRQRLKDDGTHAVRAKIEREVWWRHARSRPKMRQALQNLSRYIGTPMVSSYRTFDFLSHSILPDQKLVVYARDDLTTLGVLHSKFHDVWTLAKCSWIGSGNDVTYSNTAVFLTFPFPAGLTPNIPAADYAADPRAIAIAAAAARLNELRENWLNPQDLIIRTPEVVPGYPDRILPRDAAAAVELKKRTLTNLYNARPAWLDNAHKALDLAVADAYGWGDDWRAGAMTEDEILARLFRLNQERAAG